MIGLLVTATGLTLWSGAAMLRGLVGEPSFHLFIQRTQLSIDDAGTNLIRDHAIASAMADYLVHGDQDLTKTWEAYGADPAALLPQTQRHLKEVRAYLTTTRWVGIAGSIISVAMMAARFTSASRALKLSGRASFALGLSGWVATVVAFPAIWGRYHAKAYKTLDWDLPPDAVLAQLYPREFYRRAGGAWFLGWALLGLTLEMFARGFATLRPNVNNPETTRS